jgi:hypothetical protein
LGKFVYSGCLSFGQRLRVYRVGRNFGESLLQKDKNKLGQLEGAVKHHKHTKTLVGGFKHFFPQYMG